MLIRKEHIPGTGVTGYLYLSGTAAVTMVSSCHATGAAEVLKYTTPADLRRTRYQVPTPEYSYDKVVPELQHDRVLFACTPQETTRNNPGP